MHPEPMRADRRRSTSIFYCRGGVVTADSAVVRITAASSRLRELCNTVVP
jgi:hypothetical protein